jgi:2-iminobutanoate/2-iminopropanoate deaminase
MARTAINSSRYSVPISGFSDMIAVPADGSFLFVSGLTSRAEDGTIVGEGDIAAQTRQVLANMKTILAEAGATMDDVVQIRTYVLDIGGWGVMEPIWHSYWRDVWPSSTLVQIARLFDERQLIEMEAVAHVSGDVRSGQRA